MLNYAKPMVLYAFSVFILKHPPWWNLHVLTAAQEHILLPFSNNKIKHPKVQLRDSQLFIWANSSMTARHLNKLWPTMRTEEVCLLSPNRVKQLLWIYQLHLVCSFNTQPEEFTHSVKKEKVTTLHQQTAKHVKVKAQFSNELLFIRLVFWRRVACHISLHESDHFSVSTAACSYTFLVLATSTTFIKRYFPPQSSRKLQKLKNIPN